MFELVASPVRWCQRAGKDEAVFSDVYGVDGVGHVIHCPIGGQIGPAVECDCSDSTDGGVLRG